MVGDAIALSTDPHVLAIHRIFPSLHLRPEAIAHRLGDVARAGHAARAGGGVHAGKQSLIHGQVHADDPARHLHLDHDMRHGDTMTLVPVNVG